MRRLARPCYAAPDLASGGVATPWKTIDWKGILQPISETEVCGPNLRYEGTYDRITDARRSDDPALPQGVWKTDLKRADWRAVATVALEALTNRTKDLQIACWLAEALTHLRGFAGLSDGLRVINALVEEFWDPLHPVIEDGDTEIRVAPVEWMIQKCGDALREVPISEATVKDERSYTMADWITGQHYDRLATKDPSVLDKAAKEGLPAVAELKLAILEVSPDFRDTLFADVRTCIGEAETLSQAMDEYCGRAAPTFHLLLDELHAIERLYLTLFPKLAEKTMKQPQQTSPPAPDAEQTDQTNAAQLSSAAAALSAGTLDGILAASDTAPMIKSREQAYALLEAVADYLMRTEPHSPVPYLVRRSVAWGHMSLGELLGEFMNTPGEVGNLYKLLGITNQREE